MANVGIETDLRALVAALFAAGYEMFAIKPDVGGPGVPVRRYGRNANDLIRFCAAGNDRH